VQHASDRSGKKQEDDPCAPCPFGQRVIDYDLGPGESEITGEKTPGQRRADDPDCRQ